jgi:hypothetical protein
MSKCRIRRIVRQSFYGKASNVFDPLAISGLAAWYDFSDPTKLFVDAGTTPVASNGDLIYQANDKSGNNRHVTQSTSGERPVYTTNAQNFLSAARFNSKSLEISGLTFSKPQTLFFVVKRVGTGEGALIGTVGQWYRFAMNKLGSGKAYLMGGAETFSISDTPLDSYSVIGCIAKSTGSVFYLNGATNGTVNESTGWLSGSKLYICATYQDSTQMTDGYVGEVLVYNGELSSGDIGLVNTYLNTKWAIY